MGLFGIRIFFNSWAIFTGLPKQTSRDSIWIRIRKHTHNFCCNTDTVSRIIPIHTLYVYFFPNTNTNTFKLKLFSKSINRAESTRNITLLNCSCRRSFDYRYGVWYSRIIQLKVYYRLEHVVDVTLESRIVDGGYVDRTIPLTHTLHFSPSQIEQEALHDVILSHVWRDKHTHIHFHTILRPIVSRVSRLFAEYSQLIRDVCVHCNVPVCVLPTLLEFLVASVNEGWRCCGIDNVSFSYLSETILCLIDALSIRCVFKFEVFFFPCSMVCTTSLNQNKPKS
jgi:hypothetical protein